MAHQKWTLPALKLTQRPTVGARSVSLIHRTSFPASDLPEVAVQEHLEQNNFSILESNPTDALVAEPTEHELACRSSEAGWKRIRCALREVVTETAAMREDQPCILCATAANLRCQQCGPAGFFCDSCFTSYHSRVNILHIAERWEGNHYEPIVGETRHVDVRQHQCEFTRGVLINVVDEYGTQHKLSFASCDCEPVAVTLARAELWSASPTQPQYAYTFRLLNLIEALVLECQVSIKDFCSALKFLSPYQHYVKRGDIYSTLINSFEEYRFLRHNIRHMVYACEFLDSGNICPACPEKKSKGEKFVLAMDAIFGLPRKKSAGVSYRDPLHENLFFGDQSNVDQFVAESTATPISTDCNNFLAGSMLRSAKRYHALDETAIFGCCCRHEFPGSFINLRHGERLAYPVWMLNDIVETYSDSEKTCEIFVMYDIACSLSRHLQSSGQSELLDSSRLCLPTFHSYGHKVSCQVVYGPRRCEGIGLSDGETMERLWSYLRRFSRMTKEMRPSHRIDVLTSALVYYGLKTKEKLPSLLLVRWDRALKVEQLAKEELGELIPAFFTDVDKHACEIKQWIDEEKLSCQCAFRPGAKLPQWQSEYVQTLQLYYSMRNEIVTVSNGIPNHAQCKELIWLSKKLESIEQKHSISCRWTPDEKVYKECEYSLQLCKKEQFLLELLRGSQRRLFLLDLKRKYADGQKIAKKLSIQISKETKLLKSLLQKYNACTDEDPVAFPEVLEPLKLEQRLRGFGSWYNVATGRKRKIIDAYLAFSRASEELSMLQVEVEHLVNYYETREKHILAAILSIAEVGGQFSRGAGALLYQLLASTQRYTSLSREAMHIINYKSTETVSYPESDSDSSYLTDDDDEDDDVDLYQL